MEVKKKILKETWKRIGTTFLEQEQQRNRNLETKIVNGVRQEIFKRTNVVSRNWNYKTWRLKKK